MRTRAVVIEDDERIRSLLTIILQKRGYEVRSFPGPLPLIEILDGTCPCPEDHVCADILITDHYMPGMTGLEFIEDRMKKGCRGMAGCTAVISSELTMRDVKKAQGLGCSIIKKPFKVKDINRWIDECRERIGEGRRLVALDRLDAVNIQG